MTPDASHRADGRSAGFPVEFPHFRDSDSLAICSDCRKIRGKAGIVPEAFVRRDDFRIGFQGVTQVFRKNRTGSVSIARIPTHRFGLGNGG